MTYEVIDTRDHPQSRRIEVFPSKEQALEFTSRKGWVETPGILIRKVDHNNYYNVIQKGSKNKKEQRIKKNISEKEAQQLAKYQDDLKVEINTVNNALKPYKLKS